QRRGTGSRPAGRWRLRLAARSLACWAGFIAGKLFADRNRAHFDLLARSVAGRTAFGFGSHLRAPIATRDRAQGVSMSPDAKTATHRDGRPGDGGPPQFCTRSGKGGGASVPCVFMVAFMDHTDALHRNIVDCAAFKVHV